MKPRKIFLIRHGESEGQINKDIYKTKPDYSLLLTPLGEKQAMNCGDRLAHQIGADSTAVYFSPFYRARQTADIVCSKLILMPDPVFVKEDPRLREQEWSGGLRENGDMNSTQQERDLFGHFYYRFKGGESCADVYDRVSDFFQTLHRDFEKEHFPNNCIIFNHGMTMRCFLKKWFHLTVEEFELLANPHNCEIWPMELQPSGPRKGKYDLRCYPRQYKDYSHSFRYPYTNRTTCHSHNLIRCSPTQRK